ncbi:MAG: sulfite exporter TauE/SafE family protein [Pseudomonadota bacterium]
MDVLTLALFLSATGLFAGVIAGLFGIGGGVVIVPALYAAFGAVGVSDETRMHAAIGTSLATIIVTSLRSLGAHRRRGAVDMGVLRAWGPWIAGGAVLGAAVADAAPARALTLIFACGTLMVAIRTAWKTFRAAAQAAADPTAPLPEGARRAALAGGTGFFSSLLGIGGGVIGVAIMTGFGRPVHQAVGTASGFGLAIAAPGAAGFALAGAGAEGLPPLSLGYVNGLGFALIAAMTAVSAPLGARLAHRLPPRLLSGVFAAYLLFTAATMLREALA